MAGVNHARAAIRIGGPNHEGCTRLSSAANYAAPLVVTGLQNQLLTGGKGLDGGAEIIGGPDLERVRARRNHHHERDREGQEGAQKHAAILYDRDLTGVLDCLANTATMPSQAEPAPHLFDEEDLHQLLRREVQRATRYQDFLSLCLIGTARPGPFVPELRASVARQIAELLRATDIVGVIGSDIAALLVHTPYSDAVMISDRIRERVGREGRVALSIGLASFPTDATSDAGLLAHAQAKLQAAQDTG